LLKIILEEVATIGWFGIALLLLETYLILNSTAAQSNVSAATGFGIIQQLLIQHLLNLLLVLL